MKFMMIYLIMINILAFLMMKLDKYKARKHAWRVPEKSFFLLSIIGGSLGTWIYVIIKQDNGVLLLGYQLYYCFKFY